MYAWEAQLMIRSILILFHKLPLSKVSKEWVAGCWTLGPLVSLRDLINTRRWQAAGFYLSQQRVQSNISFDVRHGITSILSWCLDTFLCDSGSLFEFNVVKVVFNFSSVNLILLTKQVQLFMRTTLRTFCYSVVCHSQNRTLNVKKSNWIYWTQ